jgi:hypothetical protein
VYEDDSSVSDLEYPDDWSPDDWPGREEIHFTIPKQRTPREDSDRMQALVASAQPPTLPSTNPFESLAVCDQTHGDEHNSATVYGHYGSVRICIRLKDTDIWVYDSAYEEV